ncbi:MAG: cupin domain-containing protein [Ruminococcaceae bacterium]|nr:cupin domain-containing protein [Oscillospiraceae bacterium]
MVYDNNNGGEYGKYFIQDLTEPATFAASSPEYKELYKRFSQRILWIDDNVVPGAFQMNTAWYYNVPERDPIFLEHSHDDTCELIGFFSSDMNNPYDLGGKIEFSLNGEAHLLTRSTLIYVPAGMPHNPMRILEVNRPIFHFSVVMSGQYDGSGTYR